jgi:hypothetical protein
MNALLLGMKYPNNNEALPSRGQGNKHLFCLEGI